MALPIYFVSVEIEGCDAGVYLNGAPLIASRQSEPCHAAPTVNEWVVDGTNDLVVVVIGVADGADQSRRPWLRVALCRGEEGDVATPDDQYEIVTIEWRPDQSTQLPAQLDHRVDVSHDWGRWCWEDAPVLDRDDEDAATEAALVLQRIHAGLESGSPGALLAFSEPKLDEVGRAYGMTPADARQRFVTGWSYLSSVPGFSLAPLDPDDIELHRYCGERLIVPRTRGGAPPLRDDCPTGPGWSLPLYFARVDGVLAVVR